MQRVQFQRSGDGVKLCIAQRATKFYAVGADEFGFFQRKFLNVIRQLARRVGVACFQRAGLLLAKLVELLDRFFSSAPNAPAILRVLRVAGDFLLAGQFFRR